MPEFEEAQNFPTRMDDLSMVHLQKFGGLYFASLFPEMDLTQLLSGITNRIPWFPWDKLKLKKTCLKIISLMQIGHCIVIIILRISYSFRINH